MKWILTITMFFLTACGMDKGIDVSYDHNEAQRQKKNEKLLEDFSSIKGTYHGVLTTKGEPAEKQDMVISMYVVYVANGIDSQGRVIMYPDLRATVYFVDQMDPMEMYELVVAFNPLTSEIKMANQGSVPQEADVFIIGKTMGANMQVDLVRFGGTFGQFVGEKEKSDGIAPVEGLDRYFYDRRYSFLTQFIGVYTGQLVYNEGNRVQNVKMSVSVGVRKVRDNNLGEPVYMPVLEATFEYVGIDIRYFLEGRYYIREKNLILTSVDQSGTGRFILDSEYLVKNKTRTITGSVSTVKGNIGKVKLESKLK